jgi:hypothetical protein
MTFAPVTLAIGFFRKQSISAHAVVSNEHTKGAQEHSDDVSLADCMLALGVAFVACLFNLNDSLHTVRRT